jgi:hypothetical protein
MKRKTLGELSQQRQRIHWGKPLTAMLLPFVLLVAGTISNADAQALDEKRFTLRGFGTLAATTHDADGIEFRRGVGQGRGVAADKVEFYTDSLAGVQFNATLNSKFDVVLQAVSRQHADGDWDVDLSQGFVRYSPDESLVLRAGRIGFDIYLLAESRQVGYSYLALRPPPEVYGLLANDEVDGGDIAYTRRIGRGLARARFFAGGGASETAFADGRHFDTDASVFGASFDYLYRGWTARVALVRYEYDSDPSFTPLVAALRMTGAPDAVAIADGIDHSELYSQGVQLGVAYDDGPMQAQVLYGVIDTDSIAGPSSNSLYALFGYRVRAFTPFASYASSRDRDPIRTTGLPALPMFAPLNGAVEFIQSTLRSTQHTFSVGMRYDFNSHFDLKLQIDRVSLRDSALMYDRRLPPGGPADMTVIGAAVDFVF